MKTMNKWEFDAPQFVDFTQPQAHDHEYDDTWFDRHTEEDDFVQRSKESGDGSDKKPQMKQPRRVLRSIGTCNKPLDNRQLEHMETNGRSPRDVKARPTRVLVADKHVAEADTKNICPSPSKRQKISAEVQNIIDSSSPAANARLQTSSPSHHLEIKAPCDDGPAANTRQRTPRSEVQSESQNISLQTKPKSPKKVLRAVKSVTSLQRKSPRVVPGSASKTASPRKVPKNQVNTGGSVTRAKETSEMSTTLKRSQSLRSRMLPTSASKATLKANRTELECQTLDSSSRGKQSEQDSKGSINTSRCKTTEELELDKIAAMKKELARTRKLAQESYKKAMTAQGYVPMRSAQPATYPVGFNFKTDERIKNPETHVQEPKIKDFTKSLREALPQSTLPAKSQTHGVTCPQPFKLTSAKSTSSLSQGGKYESVAERVLAFHRKTPDRFRSQAHGSKERSRSANKSESSGCARRLRSQSPKLTVAKTPNLMTRGRSRPVRALSRAEKEEMEFEEQQKYHFKAHPVNHKVFEAPSLPKVIPKQPTVVEEFNLQPQRSASMEDVRGGEKDAPEDKYEFHARPVNRKILAGPVGVKPVESLPVTIPESPAFALKNRIRVPVELQKKEENKERVKVNPVPYVGIPFRPRLDHHFTIPEPFTVEERSREMLNRREQKIQQILEEERKMHEFYAQGLPSDSPDQLPPKQVKPVTQPEPFCLEIDERGHRYQEEFKSKLEEEERTAREIAHFKAGPNNIIHKEPFQPLKSSKPLTEKSNFALSTDIRAAQREAFDQHLKAREAELEALKRLREERQKNEEKAGIARMRQEAVHKASAIKKYKSVVIKPSDKPLTDAQSPKFSQRIRSRHNNSDV